MPRLVKIPIEEAKSMKRNVARKAKVLEKYKSHIKSLNADEAGKFKIRDEKDGFAIRAGLKRAAHALGEKVTIRKRGNEIVFWREDS
jgi:hypothetical protein